MGCALSKKKEEGDDVVSLCQDRKRLLKLAVKRRYDFADAQSKYNQCLYAVAMALRLFVARHSSPSSPFLITFPSNNDNTNNTIDHPSETLTTHSTFLHQQRPTAPTHRTLMPCQSLSDLASSKLRTSEKETQESETVESEEEDVSESEDGEVVCEHFYDEVEVGPTMPSPQRECTWDFFNPFDELRRRTEVVNCFSQSSAEDLRAVKEEEGIPELEEEDGERVINECEAVNVKTGNVGHAERGDIDVRKSRIDDANVDLKKSKGLRVIETPTDGRELLEALRDIEDHFFRAYESGLVISRMLEANRPQLQSLSEEIKGNSNKLFRSITLNRSTSFRSFSSKALLTSSSMNSSMWAETKADMFDENVMESGSHSLTLGRLYAWEKKLFQEVKVGDQTQKVLKRKRSRLGSLNAKGDGLRSMDKSRDEVTELHTRITVAIRTVESISNRIQKLRDEELQPQLLELLHGLMRNWKVMLESHETQSRVMLEVKSYNCPSYGKFCNDSHRLATLQLEAELDNWSSSFTAYVATQKAYIEALSGWLSKFVDPEVDFYSKVKSSSAPEYQINYPPLLVTCHNWLACLEKLPDKTVKSTMKSFSKDVHALWSQQGEEQQQKRKVDGLAKELEKRALTFQTEERRILESKVSKQEPEIGSRNGILYLAERKNLLDTFKKRVEAEKGKHLASIEETHHITLTGFQAGFFAVLESLAKFSKASVKMYGDLVTYCTNVKAHGS